MVENEAVNSLEPAVVAAFTVKHELVRWMADLTDEELQYFVVHAFHDGVKGRVCTLAPSDLL